MVVDMKKTITAEEAGQVLQLTILITNLDAAVDALRTVRSGAPKELWGRVEAMRDELSGYACGFSDTAGDLLGMEK